MLLHRSHSIAMLAAHECNSYVYVLCICIISCVHIIRAYNTDDLYHTGQSDPPDMVKIVYIVCACVEKINYIDIL